MTAAAAELCPDPECAVDGCTLEECCPAIFCYCSKALDCWTETADYLDDGQVRRYCQDHKAEWVADR